MPSNKPRVTLYFEKQEMEILEAWAGQEFLTVPQLTRVVVKRAIAEYLKQHPLESVTNADHPSDPHPTEPQPVAAKPATAAKAKRGKASKGAS
ncbi:hypothetical protein QUB75_23060 [Microcoleus sp. K1-B6]|uniref:hypothetical protein n=1 Tax=unclassified Microcoleus TaxID=2642155 RepID=UPI002FD0B24E